MRIAHVGVEVLPAANGAFVGGLVKDVATVAAAQRRRGDEVDVFTTDVRGLYRDGQDAVHGRIHPIPTRGTYGSFLFASTFMTRGARALRRAHRERPYDLVHVHSAYAVFASMGKLLGGIDAPKVFSLYSPNFRTVPGHDCNGALHLGGEAITRRALRSFDLVVAPSANLHARLLRIGVPPERVAEVPPALDPAFLSPPPPKEAAKRALGLDDPRPRILFVGNYSPWKGVEVLLESVARLRRAGRDVQLVTAWGEPYAWGGNRREQVLGLMRRLGLEDAVDQVGIVPDIRTLLQAADVLASPFLCTCKVLDQPLSILEAMACDTPVIGTDVGGVPELLGRDGRGTVVPPGRPDLLAEALDRALADPGSASRQGTAGGRWARTHADPRRVLGALDALYARLGTAPFPSGVHPSPAPN